MTCDDFQHALHDYFRGELPPAAASDVDRHAATCAACGGLMAWAREISCRDFTDLLNEYVDGRMVPERRRIVDRHLELCVDCRNYLQSYRAAMERSALSLGRGLDVLAMPVPEDLILAVLRAARRDPDA